MTTNDARIDRLLELLPAIYRMRDAGQQYPLQALLRVLAEQVNIVEDNITQLYENWFIETADQWAVPYIGDLIGYKPVQDAGSASGDTKAEARALIRYLIPRREVANTIRYRRGKGRLSLLEQLASDVAGWPARAVEFFKRLGWNQNIDHLHLDRARLVDVRRMDDLDLIDGPFDRLAHTVDVRRTDSGRTPGRYNIPSVGVFIWRLRSYSVTHTPAYCAENAGPHCTTFSVLGQCAPLFIKPAPRTGPGCAPATEMNFPEPIRRVALAQDPGRFYGADKSLAIWADGWAGFGPDQPVPVQNIVPADLTDWQYVPPHDHIAVDPVLGRLAFPPGQLPRKGVRVTYHYGFSADMGGGEYDRPILEPSPRTVDGQVVSPSFYRVGKGEAFHRIGDALRQWQADNPWDADIELTDASVYVEPIDINLGADRTLQLRAANRTRPVLRLLDWQTDLPDALSVTMGPGSRFAMDGLLITGRAVQVTGSTGDGPGAPRPDVCGSELVIRHCTLVPGWGIDCDCEPKRPAEPSVELYGIRARVRVEHSILGSIQVYEDETRIDPIPIVVTDSILDATDPEKQAIGGPGSTIAHAVLTVRRSTVFGIVDVHAIEVGQDSIFNHCVNVARRQLGCLRFCYVPPGCRTPRRYHCQPDLVAQAALQGATDPAAQKVAVASEQLRVRPQFSSERYSKPGYARLSPGSADEIQRGAEDRSEMGAFHDLFQPQRRANLIARLNEFTPAGMEVAILFADEGQDPQRERESRGGDG
jgi:hypothetical protein